MLFATVLLTASLLSSNGVLIKPIEQNSLPIVQVQLPKQSAMNKAALERLLTSEKVQADWFSSEFLAHVPISQIEQIISSLKQGLGDYQKVEEQGKNYRVVFARGYVPTQIGLDSNGKIAMLFFQPPVANSQDLKEAIAELKTLPGKVGFLVLEGKTERAALNADTPLAVGSAFKLAVLQALKSQISAKERSWGDVVELKSEWKSLPSGILQTWPDGSLLTLQTLSALMISQSDNTATDALINIIGRPTIEKITPRNVPLLTTRELFILKSSKNQELLKRYRNSNVEEKREILQSLAQQSLPDVSEFTGNPVALDIEWFFTARELCSLIEQVADLPLMSINPGVANAEDWERVAFKGGSESGVLNLTTWLKAKNGKQYCVVGTWNHDAPLEQNRFMTIYSSAIAGLKD
ncbi:serine hydrolase [Calothrix sp. FACHB-1219]|uniref:serine hydrolase n=1 Tax=unclassified Calothrix TaxID=2619626 RepID=UPI0016894604|nr:MULTISPECIES: serine hydrolase [unclassified Calothrix]MBD2206125.1 serine hydrolase [Calothrix sp. FACHB-168]MBD2220895.1 serine hydrolase [Calothrix sp. FACHB-1219]